MRKLIISLLAVAVACAAAPQVAVAEVPLPNLKAITAYDFKADDLMGGADSDVLRWPFAEERKEQDKVTLLSLNVGYLSSDDTSIWILGGAMNVGNLARKAHLDYGWGLLQTEIGGYGGRNFETREWHYGVKASIFKLEFATGGGGE